MIRVQKLKDNAILPTKGSAQAAGWDLYAAEGAFIPAGATVKIGTGLAMEIPNGFWGGVFARSGLATKHGLRPANCVGVIDSDYRGEIKVPMINLSTEVQTIKNGDRIAQMVIMPIAVANIEIVQELTETTRGAGGFGSTGV